MYWTDLIYCSAVTASHMYLLTLFFKWWASWLTELFTTSIFHLLLYILSWMELVLVSVLGLLSAVGGQTLHCHLQTVRNCPLCWKILWRELRSLCNFLLHNQLLKVSEMNHGNSCSMCESQSLSPSKQSLKIVTQTKWRRWRWK